VDNYGDGSTPIVGAQIAAFQGHHQRPWTITEREFCNNLYKVGLLSLTARGSHLDMMGARKEMVKMWGGGGAGEGWQHIYAALAQNTHDSRITLPSAAKLWP